MALYTSTQFVLLFMLCILYNLKKLLLHKLTTEHTLHSKVKLSITQTWNVVFPKIVESQSKLI